MKMFFPICSVLLASAFATFGATQTVTIRTTAVAGSLCGRHHERCCGRHDYLCLLDAGDDHFDERTSCCWPRSLTITGPGADLLSVKRSNAAGIPEFRVLHITSGNFAVTVSGLTVTNGDDPVDEIYGGGGLYNECAGSVVFVGCRFTDNQAFNNGGAVLHNGSGSLSLTDCGITGNVDLASSGGGLAVEVESGPTTILRCTISSNTGHYFGGGIFNGTGSTMVISESTISGNVLVGDQFHGDGDGGGISNDGTITIADSAIADNSNGRGNGGGIRNQGTMTVTNSTFFGNSTLFNGGGILNNGPAVMIACTITQNIAVQDDLATEPYKGGGGISDYGVINSLMIQDTIVANNHSYLHPDVAGKITSQGYNLIGDGTGGIFTPATGDQVGTFAAPVNPLLGQLANNGGPTETCALLSDSPAIDAGDPQAPISDQRDYDRQDDAPDIGAFELGATIPRTLANISTRLFVGAGDDVLIGGFIVTGTHAKQVLLRGIGPSLSLDGKLADPSLELHDASGDVIATNNNWQTNDNAQKIVDTGIPPTDPLESAILTTSTRAHTRSCSAGRMKELASLWWKRTTSRGRPIPAWQISRRAVS